MSKKIVVLGMLLLLFSSMASALDIQPVQPGYVPIQPGVLDIEQSMDDESNQAVGDFWVWLEVPENIPAAVAGQTQTFWVDLYVTPSKPSSSIYSLMLKLKPSNNKVKFTGIV